MRANSKPHINPNKNSDLDASLGHKGFGYSGTVNMDKATKLVRATEVTPANVLDYKSIIAYNFYRLVYLMRNQGITA